MKETIVYVALDFYLQMKSLISLILVPHSEEAVEASEEVYFQIRYLISGALEITVLTLRRTEEPVPRFSSLPFPVRSPG